MSLLTASGNFCRFSSMSHWQCTSASRFGFDVVWAGDDRYRDILPQLVR
jgi:hypothetical protein